MIQPQKIIVFLFVLLLLFYMIRLLISTKQNQKFKTYPFVVLIGGLILLIIATFLDMVNFNNIKNQIFDIQKLCYTLGAIIYVIGVILWSNFTHRMIKQLEKITLYDPMTSILNRNGLEKNIIFSLNQRIVFISYFVILMAQKKSMIVWVIWLVTNTLL